MSLVEQYHQQHRNFHKQIEQKAALLKIKKPVEVPRPAVRIVYFQDDNYHRCWSIEMLGHDPESVSVYPKIGDVQRAVCAHYGITMVDLLSKRRHPHIARPRMAAAYLCRMLTRKSYPEIARKFGNRDHSTLIHSFKVISREMETDQHLCASIEMLTHKLGC